MADDPLKQAWSRFCQEIEAAGHNVLASELVGSEPDRAEALRYITRLLRISLDMNLENADALRPSFYQASHATAKIGADNPDNFYQNATISGDQTYIIRGTRGTVPILSFATKANRYAVDGTMASTGEIDVRDITMTEDGAFEITVSREKPSTGNWLPMAHDSSMLIVRQTFFDKTQETPACVTIENASDPGRPAPLSEAALATALSRVPAFVAGTAKTFEHWASVFRESHKNQLSTIDQSMFIKAGGDPMIYYLHGWWELSSGQALKIQTEIPVCEGWNFQLNNIWMESLDYRHHQVHVNNASAVIDDDGRVTIFVSGTDPGADTRQGNWIDTAGHTRGTMLLRWTAADHHPLPNCEVIDL